MNGLGRGIRIRRIEKDNSSIQVVPWADLYGLFGHRTVAQHQNMILKGAELYRPPGDTFDNAHTALSDNDYVTYLKRLICVKRYAGKQVAKSILQCKSDDYAENRRCREQRAKVYFRKKRVEYQNKRDNKCND